MKTWERVYVCGSFRFIKDIEMLEKWLKEENLEYLTSKETDEHGIVGCLKIDKADIVYVVNPNDYIGISVSIDIGYVYAKGKPIYILHPTEDSAVMNLISGVLSFEELIEMLKQ